MEDDSPVNTKTLLSERLKTVVDHSGAGTLATIVGNAERSADRRASVALSGGNVNMERFTSLAHGASA
ncbi:hypothetical protein [Streptomyces malaysiensis]|uniref:Threonine dehydratase, catabolic, PLP-dependent n=1 Tax=Streptomyces malaysiensis TaxID=92644 RepID=A0A7X6B0Z4_STRMQ|nr:hypothetical protein [Streptomyces malaysiensis]NIY69335.1 threonine dehydratase, catabolic, PLP-dependent [Streptomyces malaysiensis]